MMTRTATSEVQEDDKLSFFSPGSASGSASLQFYDWKGSVTLEVELWRILRIKPTKQLH